MSQRLGDDGLKDGLLEGGGGETLEESGGREHWGRREGGKMGA